MIRGLRYSCEKLAFENLCGSSVRHFVFFGNVNTNGILETTLQCPQCGCGAKGAANLNDHYIEEQTGSRKVSDVANIM